MTRLGWVGKTEPIALARQCVLAGVARATVYAQQKAKLRIGAGMQDDEALKRLIDEEYTRHPFFGSRKMVVYLKRCEHQVNRKRVRRLCAARGANRYYHLTFKTVSTSGWRAVLCIWWPSSTGTRGGCSAGASATAWKRRSAWTAWKTHCACTASPKCSNSDQGAQFTSESFCGVLQREGITISMDGRGRAFDLHIC